MLRVREVLIFHLVSERVSRMHLISFLHFKDELAPHVFKSLESNLIYIIIQTTASKIVP